MTVEPKVPDQNLALLICADPRLMTSYIGKISDPSWKIPDDYEIEIREVLKTKITMISDINSPDDYKVLVQASCLIKMCKERLAFMVHHLKSLSFKWSNLSRQATRHIETNYYTQMNSVKDSIRKAVLTSALEPIEEGVYKLKYLLELAEGAQSHLNDVNWAVKDSASMVTNYFQAVRNVAPLPDREL